MNGKPMLAAQQLEVALSGRPILNGVSLSLPSGHLVALVGPNGAGKTTLLRALAGLVPSTGSIEIGGGPPSPPGPRGPAVLTGAAGTCAPLWLSAARPCGALAAAGERCRRARALSPWCDRSGAA